MYIFSPGERVKFMCDTYHGETHKKGDIIDAVFIHRGFDDTCLIFVPPESDDCCAILTFCNFTGEVFTPTSDHFMNIAAAETDRIGQALQQVKHSW